MVGLQWSGIVVDSPGTLVGLGNLRNPPVLLAIFGVGTVSLLMVLKVQGAILWGMGASVLAGLVSGLLQYQGLVSPPPSLAPVFLRLDIAGALDPGLATVIFVFLMLALFDTAGTLIGVSQQAGFLKDGKLPRAREALLADAMGTVDQATGMDGDQLLEAAPGQLPGFMRDGHGAAREAGPAGSAPQGFEWQIQLRSHECS